MITSLSLMRRRGDIDNAAFRKHWLDPHGVVTAELPLVRRYVQGHVIDSPIVNALARELAIDGFAVLTFDSFDDRETAYSSPKIRECDKDSERFVGSVTRVVSRTRVVAAPPVQEGLAKVYVLRTGTPEEAESWSDAHADRVGRLPGVRGQVRHKVLAQGGAPGSKVPEFKLPVAAAAEVWFEDGEALLLAADTLAEDGEGEASDRIALYPAQDVRLI